MDQKQQQFATSPPREGYGDFGLLPDEILLKILRMALKSAVAMTLGDSTDNRPTHLRTFRMGCFLVNGLSKVSQRFKRLTADRSLLSYWNRQIEVHGSQWQIKEFVHEVISKEAEIIKELCINGVSDKDGDLPIITAADIGQLAAMCSNLNTLSLTLVRMPWWPPGIAPWVYLKELTISRIESASNLFKDVNLNDIAPNLETLMIEGLNRNSFIILPNMSNNEALRSITLNDGTFEFPDKIGFSRGFPRGLKELKGSASIRCALYNQKNERLIFTCKNLLNYKHAIFCKQIEGQEWFKLN